MRILYLCHRIPYPPDKGDKIRAFYQIQAMATRHEVDLFTLADDRSDLLHRSALERYCQRVVVAGLNPRVARLRALPYLLTRKPLTLPYFHSPELRRSVREALARRAYDRLFVYCSAMAQYVETDCGIPLITDLVDVDSDKWAQYATFASMPFAALYRREAKMLQEYERKICEKSACIIVTTEREARLARRISPAARVHVISNGVDVEYFKPVVAPASPDVPTVGFTGDMSYFPNEQAVTYFARKVLPLIRQSLPGVRFLIVGRNPGKGVQRLREIGGVEVTGFVPDVRVHLARTQVSVAPFTIAAGIQNKILEAMASGIPVVGTSRAVQGLSEAAAKAVDVADSAPEMAAKVIDLLRHPELAREVGSKSRRLVSQEYSWARSLDRFLECLENPAVPETPRAAAYSPLS